MRRSGSDGPAPLVVRQRRARAAARLPCGRAAAPARGARESASPARWRRSSRRTSRPPLPGRPPPPIAQSPRFHSSSRRPPTSSGSSANLSIRIQRAPSSAAAHVGHALIGVDVARPRPARARSVGSCEQRQRERFEPGFAGDLRPRPPLRAGRAGRDPRAAPWCRPRGSRPRAPASACPAPARLSRIAVTPLFELAQVDAAAPRACAIACRRARRSLPCGSAR